MKYTPEQTQIGESVRAGKHVIVDAVAGSGKTTSALYLADIVYPRRTLILLYNKRLARETGKKIPSTLAATVEATTIHSLAFRVYSDTSNPLLNDELLQDILDRDAPVRTRLSPFGLIVIDEAQDLVPLYYHFIRKIMRDLMHADMQVAVYGDCRQTIYAYNGADMTYLMHADTHFTPDACNRAWARHVLSVSFRVPSSIAHFVNKAMLHETRIVPHRESTIKPVYAICNVFSPQYVVDVIKTWIRKYSANDIFVLCPSTKNRGPVLKVLNTLTNDGVPLYIMESNLDPVYQDRVMHDKVVFSTFHKSKGLERKCVLVFGFDSSYFEYYNPDAEVTSCPNELYVAVTRASHELVLVAAHNQNPLPFLDEAELDRRAAMLVINKPTSIRRRAPEAPSRVFQISALAMTANKDELSMLRALVDVVDMDVTNGRPIDIPVLDKAQQEDVSDLNGKAVTIFYEYCLKNCVSFMHEMKKHNEIKFLSKDRIETIHRHITDFVLESAKVFDVSKFLRFVTSLEALHSQVYYRVFQLKSFNWLTVRHFTDIFYNMQAAFGDVDPAEVAFEVPCSAIVAGCGAMLVGRIDMIANDTEIIEIKCCSDMLIEHVLQCVFYMYTMRTHRCLIYNVKRNIMQMVTLSSEDFAALDTYVEAFISARF